MMRKNCLATLAALTALAVALPMPAHCDEAEAAARLESDVQKAKADIAQAKKDIQKAEGELRKTDSLIQEEAAAAAQTLDRQAKDRERREKENAGLQARLQETQGKIDAEHAAASRSQNAADEIKARGKHLAQVLAGYCDSLAARIEAGPPWDRELRLDRVKSLKKDLESGSATMDEGFARLGAVIKEEVKGGDEIALLNKPVTRKNGEVVNAQILKIGNQWLVYMDEEGKNFGILERKASASGTGWTWEWREDPGFAEKNAIRSAIEIKSAKRPPQLAVLTLGITPGTLPAGTSQTSYPAEGGKK